MHTLRHALAGLAVVTLVGGVFAAPPEDINQSRNIVGKLVEAGTGYVVVATTGEKDAATASVNVRVPFREGTQFLLNDEPVRWTDLRKGDSIRIVPYTDAPGVAQKITAARTGTLDDDAKDQALKNRALDAAGRLRDKEAREDRERTSDSNVLTRGHVYVIELPANSAAARAGFRPGDVVIFSAAGNRDASILRGLPVRRTNLGARFVIDALDDDVDVRVRPDPRRVDDEAPDVKIEIDKD